MVWKLNQRESRTFFRARQAGKNVRTAMGTIFNIVIVTGFLTFAGCGANQTPLAEAGWDQTVVEGSTVRLNGSGRDADGSVVNFRWEQIGGTRVSILNDSQASASFLAPRVDGSATLTFRLTVVDDDGGTASDDVAITAVDYGRTQVTVSGTVKSFKTGAAISGATVAVTQYDGRDSRKVGATQTDRYGSYDVQLSVQRGRAVVTANAKGFASKSTIVDLSGTTEANADIAMVPVQLVKRFQPNKDVEIKSQDRTLVSVLADTLEGPNGKGVVGEATALVTVLDPSRDPSVMPGDLIRWNVNAQEAESIESFGAMNVVFQGNNGERLNLKPERQATVSIPLAKRQRPENSPETIPLFFWSEVTGYWIEDGDATLKEVAPGRWAYVGKVGHFSTWNADIAYDAIVVRGCVNDQNGSPIEHAEVSSRGTDYIGTSEAESNFDGLFEIQVRPSSTFQLSAVANSGFSDAVTLRSESADIQLRECLIVSSDEGIQDFPMRIRGFSGELEICVRDHECEDGDRISVDANGRELFSGEIVNDWACNALEVSAGKSYLLKLTALNGTGYKGACSYANVNTGEIRVTGENIATQVWRHRGGTNSQARILVESIASPITITSHRNNDRVTSRIVEIEGEADSSGGSGVTLHYNGVDQRTSLNNEGRFRAKIVLKGGRNTIRACQGSNNCTETTLTADIERLSLMATLTWSGGGDLDLHVITPDDRHCSYRNKNIPGACRLDIDDQNGANPENISIPVGASRGTYRFKVKNYSHGRGPGTLSIYKDGVLFKSVSLPLNIQRDFTSEIDW